MTTEVRALTLHQPWASLVALRVKLIETRSWSTRYRGKLLIHAGVKRPPSWVGPVGDYQMRPFGRFGWALEGPGLPAYRSTPRLEGYMVPFGAVVASCTLADVVPMVDRDSASGAQARGPRIIIVGGRGPTNIWHERNDGQMPRLVDDQRPYGDFAPGRYAWLLEDIEPIDPPIPAKGRQGLWVPEFAEAS